MRLQLRSLVAAVAILFSLAAGHSAKALDITFDLTQITDGQTTDSLTSSGYTLLFTGVGGFLTADSNGLTVDGNLTFTITKTAGATDLYFKSYNIGSESNFTGNALSFNLTGGTGTSNNNMINGFTTKNYNGSYSLGGSQTVTYSLVNFGVNGLDGDTVNFTSLTFSTVPVPEPSTYALATIATGVMAAVARRRKAKRA